MSRAKRKQQKYVLGFIPQNRAPIVLAVLGLLVIGIAAVIVVNSGAAPGFAPKVTGSPAIQVEQSFFDLGDVNLGRSVQVNYTIRNEGDQTLRILEVPQVEVREGC
jgi:flagellar basal body-associated protein FliL